jgi:hypothetical protein
MKIDKKYRNYTKLYFFLLLISILSLESCRSNINEVAPKNTEVIGEGDFRVVSAFTSNVDTVDFEKAGVFFKAKFSAFGNWKIDIVGLNNKNVFTMQGSSNILDSNNTFWKGKGNRPPSFGNEIAQATLTFEDSDLIFKKDIFVKSKVLPQNVMGSQYLIASFDDDETEKGSAGGYSVSKDGGDEGFSQVENTYGGTYARLKGTDSNTGLVTDLNRTFTNLTGYFGNININPTNVYGNEAKVFPIPKVGASSLYINFYLYGLGDSAPFSYEIDINESDAERYKFSVFNVRWSGWRLVSIPYGSFSLNSASVNNQKDTDKITSVQFLPYLNNKKVDFAIDNPIFTINSPFKY